MPIFVGATGQVDLPPTIQCDGNAARALAQNQAKWKAERSIGVLDYKRSAARRFPWRDHPHCTIVALQVPYERMPQSPLQVRPPSTLKEK